MDDSSNSGVVVRMAAAILLSACFASCHARSPSAESTKELNEKFILLGLVGYNYTDRHISAYSINGAGGGHINLSSPTSGGSGVACCARVSKKTLEPILIKVRWQVDGCKTVESNPRTGASAEIKHFFYKEAEITIPPTAIERQRYFETHFYPDGSVQVNLTQRASEPRIILDAKRADKSFFPRCKNEKYFGN